MAFTPLHDRVLVRRIEGEEKTKGGLIIPDTAKEKPAEAEVVSVGPGARKDNGELIAPSVKAGDRVRVRQDAVPGHTRLPAYIRGKQGVVVSESPPYPFPDAHAHGVVAEDEPTFDVRFRSEDLWPDAVDVAAVHVGVFQSYLERVA